MSELRKRGLHAAVICSDPFLILGQTQARVLGVPDLPLIVIPHPLGDLAPEQVAGRAAIALPQLVSLAREMAA